MANANPGPCGGLNVVDLGQGMAGAMPGMVLADNGASVIKVEPPRGDWARDTPGFLMWNRNKRSVVLDLDDEKGRRKLRALVRRADVVIDAYRPGVAASLGLDTRELRQENPRLIHCSISGFGPATAYADVAGYEALVSAAIGRMEGLDHLNGAVKGQDREAPIFTAAPVASYGAAQLAVQGILAALIARDRTGQGARLETSLVQGAAAFLMRQELPRNAGKGAPLVSAATHAGIELCFMTAQCRDGRFLQMCARQDAQFRNWLRAIGLEGVFEDPVYARAPMGIARLEDVAELDRRIRERMATKTQAEWMDLFTTTFDVGCDPFLTPAEFLAHPQMVENGRVVEFDDPSVGRCRQVGPLVVIEDQAFPTPKPAPLLGEHTAEVLAELSEDEPAGVAAVPPAVTSRRPLEGITVVELAYFIAGPLAGALLAELGARVIKVEPLDGDPYRRTGLQSAKFLHGKESIALDLKAPEGQAILHQLVAGADVFVHSFRPGVPERLGVDYATLSSVNPSLVYLYAASYGSKGPQAKRTAFHSTPNALSGAGIIQAGAGNPPVDDSFPDPGSAIAAATAMLLGLRARSVTGKTYRLETTMLASTGYIMSPWLVDYRGAPATAVADTGQHGLGALYRLYRTGDGWLFLACVQPAEWTALSEALGHREWAANTRFATREARHHHDQELAASIGAVLASGTSTEWVERLGAAGVPVVVASTSPQEGWWEAQGLLSEASHPIFGDYWRPPAKVDIDGLAPRQAPAAAIGEHSRALLAELGYDPAKIGELIAAGVVGAWSAASGD